MHERCGNDMRVISQKHGSLIFKAPIIHKPQWNLEQILHSGILCQSAAPSFSLAFLHLPEAVLCCNHFKGSGFCFAHQWAMDTLLSTFNLELNSLWLALINAHSNPTLPVITDTLLTFAVWHSPTQIPNVLPIVFTLLLILKLFFTTHFHACVP